MGDHVNANARALGSYQADEFKRHEHKARSIEKTNILTGTTNNVTSYALSYYEANMTLRNYSGADFGSLSMPDGGVETRPPNTALAPRIIAF